METKEAKQEKLNELSHRIKVITAKLRTIIDEHMVDGQLPYSADALYQALLEKREELVEEFKTLEGELEGQLDTQLEELMGLTETHLPLVDKLEAGEPLNRKEQAEFKIFGQKQKDILEGTTRQKRVKETKEVLPNLIHSSVALILSMLIFLFSLMVGPLGIGFVSRFVISPVGILFGYQAKKRGASQIPYWLNIIILGISILTLLAFM